MTGSLAAVLVDPVLVTWKALGAPAPVATSGPVARCGRCSQEQSLKLLREILSSNFTGWESIDPSSSGLCESCAWAYQEPRLRTSPICITTDAAHWVSRAELASLLSSALPATHALVIPIRGQKHLLPSAEWGCVSSDSGVFLWGSDAAEMFSLVERARALGALKSDFTAGAPGLGVVREAGSESFAWWDTFRRWQGTPHFEIAVMVACRSEEQ